MNKIHVINIEEKTLENTNYRKVIETTPSMQLVLMSLNGGETIDSEIHDESDQFFRIEKGLCKIEIYNIVDNKPSDILLYSVELKENDVTIVPKNTCHKLINTGNDELKLYTIYSPPHHAPNRLNVTKEDADNEDNNIDNMSEGVYKSKLNKYKRKIEILINVICDV